MRAEVGIFDFDRDKPEDLKGYDVVEMIGGNLFYLLDSIRNNGFEGILQRFALDKCVIGCSAGLFVLTKALELVNMYSSEMNIIGLESFDALYLTKDEILPHYSKYSKRVENFESKCEEYERLHSTQVISLNDGDGLIIQDENSVRIIKH